MPCGRIFANWSLSEVEKPQKGIVKEPGQLLSGIAHCLFQFYWTSCNLLGGEITASHLKEEMHAIFEISVLNVFCPQKQPCWNVKDFNNQ